MKKYSLRVLSAVLSATTLLSFSTPVNVNAVEKSKDVISSNQSFTMYEDDKGIHFIGPTGNDAISSDDVSTYEKHQIVLFLIIKKIARL